MKAKAIIMIILAYFMWYCNHTEIRPLAVIVGMIIILIGTWQKKPKKEIKISEE